MGSNRAVCQGLGDVVVCTVLELLYLWSEKCEGAVAGSKSLLLVLLLLTIGLLLSFYHQPNLFSFSYLQPTAKESNLALQKPYVSNYNPAWKEGGGCVL